MDRDLQTVQILDALSPRRDEGNLSGLDTLRLVAEDSANEQIRQSAAVELTSVFETRWATSSATPIPDGEKEKIKTLMVPVVLSASQKLQVLLSETPGVIGNHDFPESWPDLLPDLKSHLEMALNADDFASANGILATVNLLFKRFRCESSSLYKKPRYESKRKSNRILLDVEYCSDNFGAPLLWSFKSISRKINTCGSVATLRQLVEAQRLCCRIFYSLNYMEVAEKLEAKADEWMSEFKNCLTVRYPGIEDANCVDDARAAVCENISLYMEKREELLHEHLSDFVEAVCGLLVVVASEGLTVSGIKFLSTVSKSGVEHGLLFGGGHEILLESIVVPNVMLRDEDEELFKRDCMEFIRRDMEFGTNPRRRNAYELVKGIARNHKEKIKEQIDKCLVLFNKNPIDNWKYKECAISLFTATATATGDDVDVESFFGSVIVPELQCEDVNKSFPMLKASALKFFTMFRVLIPKHVAMPLFGDVVRFVGSNVKVVHSYAATCIEKLLLVKEDDKKARYTSMDIDLTTQRCLISTLVDTLEKRRFNLRNRYLMRCLARALEMASDVFRLPVATCTFVLDKAIQALTCCRLQTSKDAVFNHFLFEAIATLVRRGCENEIQPGFVRQVEKMFGLIVDLKVTELYPYAFQLLAQLVDLHRPLPQLYMQWFDIYFSVERVPDLWDNSAIVPALVLALQSYLRRAPDEVNTKGRLSHLVLGAIKNLVSSPSTEEEGFRLLNTVIENYGYDVISKYTNHIWASLLNRLQISTTTRLVRCVMVFMSLFLVKHGVQTLVDSLPSVDLFHVILGDLWIPYLKTISTNYSEVKLCAVASTKLLYESPLLLDPAAEELWGKLLDAIVTLLLQQVIEEEDDDDEPDLTQGFRFVRLKNVGGKEDWDSLKEIEDPKQFLLAFPANLSSQFHGGFPLVIKEYLSPPNQTQLVKLCNSYHVAIV